MMVEVSWRRNNMKIMLAVDGSPCSEAAVEEVAIRPWPPNSELRVISVVEPHTTMTAEPWVATENYFAEVEKIECEEAKRAIDRAVALLRKGKGSADLHLKGDILHGSARRVIIEEAEAWGAELIVLGSHGYKTWERLLLGSVSQAVALHAGCSVEIIRHK
jgi:nucleotide-binding universal stress UspA family protein